VVIYRLYKATYLEIFQNRVSAIKVVSVVYECHRPVEEEDDEDDEDDEYDEETEIPRTVPKRQVAKRHRFTLYEKMTVFRLLAEMPIFATSNTSP